MKTTFFSGGCSYTPALSGFFSFLIIALITGTSFNTLTQSPGDSDPAFNPTDIDFGFEDKTNGAVKTRAIQSVIIFETFLKNKK